jgi:hypothetical protein
MSHPDAPPFPLWFPLFFIGMWLLGSAFSALISGLGFLARRFRANSRPEGQKVTGQVKQMGIVPENRVTHMIVSDSGLYLYASLLFRFMHPALLIPWREVRLVREIKTLWWYTYELDLVLCKGSYCRNGLVSCTLPTCPGQHSPSA